MSGRAWAWLLLAGVVTLLVELPANWLSRGLGLPASGVSGSVWQGQASQVGAVGPVRWDWRPWRLHAEVQGAYQGQGWQARLQGWPWRWQAQVQALGPQVNGAPGFRLAGRWQGQVRVEGSAMRCRNAQGRLEVDDLALVEPWSLGLGRGWLAMDCTRGWRLLGQLAQPKQHQVELDADLLARQARLSFEVQPEAALTPLLRGAQWLGADDSKGERRVRW